MPVAGGQSHYRQGTAAPWAGEDEEKTRRIDASKAIVPSPADPQNKTGGNRLIPGLRSAQGCLVSRILS
jgi:hypothetical protein